MICLVNSVNERDLRRLNSVKCDSHLITLFVVLFVVFNVRGEILGFVRDKPLRKHLRRVFSLICLNHFPCRLEVGRSSVFCDFEHFMGTQSSGVLGGSMVARLKLDTTREKLTRSDTERMDRLVALARFNGWWCMAVLSWWRLLRGTPCLTQGSLRQQQDIGPQMSAESTINLFKLSAPVRTRRNLFGQISELSIGPRPN